MRTTRLRRPGLVLGAACAAVCLAGCASAPSGATETGADGFVGDIADVLDGATETERGDADEPDSRFVALSPPARADLVVDAPHATGAGFLDADKAVNGVRGGGRTSGSTDVFSLGLKAGVDDHLVLGWSGRRVVDGPGVDLVVFENAFETPTGKRFMDPTIVEVSSDGETWVAFPHDYTAPDETKYVADPELWQGFAGRTPVYLHAEDNPVDPFDAEAAGGDGFDLADLQGEAGARVRAEGVLYVRLVSAATRTNPDTGANFVRDAAANGPDIDGVWARALVSEGDP